jgi:hypothetical protein
LPKRSHHWIVIEPVPEKETSAVNEALEKSPLEKSPVILKPLVTLKATADGIQLAGKEAKTDMIEGNEIEVPATIEIEEGSP